MNACSFLGSSKTTNLQRIKQNENVFDVNHLKQMKRVTFGTCNTTKSKSMYVWGRRLAKNVN